MKNWKKNSWRKYPVKHIPEYPDRKEEEKKKNMFQFPETPHLKGIVVENKETDYYVKNEGEEINSPTNNAETSN